MLIFLTRAAELGRLMFQAGICVPRWRQIIQAFKATSVAAINLKVDQWWNTPPAQNLFRQGQATVQISVNGSGRYWEWSYTSAYGDRMGSLMASSREAAVRAATSSSNSLIRSALRSAQYTVEEQSAWQAFQGICPASLLYLFSPPSSGKSTDAGSKINVKVKMNLGFKARKSCRGCNSSGSGLGTSLLGVSARCSWVKSGKPSIDYELEIEPDNQICSQLMQSIQSFVDSLDPARIAKKLNTRPTPEQQAQKLFDQFMKTLAKPTCDGPSSAEGTTTVNLGTVKVDWNSFPVPV